MTAPLDRRERILRRLAAAIASMRGPGSTSFRFDDGSLPVRDVVTDLGGRVDARMRQDDRSAAELPAVEVLTDGGSADALEVVDGQTYQATMAVEVYGYAAARLEDGQTVPSVRTPLNELRADLIVALECFPWWTGAGVDEQDPITRHGPVSVQLTRQWTESDLGQDTGFLVIEAQIRYLFTTRDP